MCLFGDSIPRVQLSANAACAASTQKHEISIRCDVPRAAAVVCHNPAHEVLAHDMFVSKNVNTATREALGQSGFAGWWSPADRVFATTTIADKTFRFIHTTPCDGA